MTRTIQIHPLSILFGVGFALLGVVAMGQMPAAKRPAAAHDSGLLQVAHPRNWVVVEEGTSYVVPPGQILVLTALGVRSLVASGFAQLSIDGAIAATGSSDSGSGNGTSMKELPIGLSVKAGSVVDLTGNAGFGRAWGYLVDA